MQKESLDQEYYFNSTKEFEKKICTLVEAKINYRKILSSKYFVNDEEIKLNVPKIKKIHDKSNSNTSDMLKDPNKALVFKCFKEGMEPSDVVIETELPAKYVKDAHNEYLEMNDLVSITFEQHDRIFYYAWRIHQSHDFNENCDSIEQAVDSYQELKEHVFYCSKCNGEIPITGQPLKEAHIFLAQKYAHSNC